LLYHYEEYDLRRSNLKKNSAFTLMEIVVAATILALVMVGLVSVFFAGKRWLAHSRFKMTGAELGKYFLDPFSVNIRQDQWNAGSSDYIAANPLYVHDVSGTAVNLNSKLYTPTYNVGAAPAPTSGGAISNQFRKVKVEVKWPED
jgi:uncharacterized protein (TIGR02598 family)